MKIGAVVVSYNSADDLVECLQSFTNQRISDKDVTFLTCVVDNASKDDSVKIARKSATNVIENDKNKGFSAAVNQGLRWLIENDVDYYLILNPDALLRPGAIAAMLDVLDSSDIVGAVGPKMINKDGSSANAGYYLKAPSLLTVTFFSTRLRFWALTKPWLVRRYEEELGEEVAEVDQIPGAAIFTSRQKLERIGLLSEEFAIWFEDVEWSYRARKKGYRLLFVPKAEFVHEGGVSFAKWNDLNKSVTFYVSMKTFFRLHKPFSEPFVILVLSLNALGAYFKSKDKDHLRFIKHFIKQKKGLLPR